MSYIRCAALGCFDPSTEIILDIPLCEAHHGRLLDHVTPKVFARTLAESNAVVYYVAWRGRPDYIKIGTTTNLRYRLKQLSTTQHPAKVLVAEPGHYYLERNRHRQFSHLRLPGEGELFKWLPQLAEHVQKVREKVGWRGGALSSSELLQRPNRAA